LNISVDGDKLLLIAKPKVSKIQLLTVDAPVSDIIIVGDGV